MLIVYLPNYTIPHSYSRLYAEMECDVPWMKNVKTCLNIMRQKGTESYEDFLPRLEVKLKCTLHFECTSQIITQSNTQICPLKRQQELLKNHDFDLWSCLSKRSVWTCRK